eukprot:Hpha_TRINITY_DN35799_c0_g1::TRINITY_DN35799_c0_g1_i1::g.139950::m.139950
MRQVLAKGACLAVRRRVLTLPLRCAHRRSRALVPGVKLPDIPTVFSLPSSVRAHGQLPCGAVVLKSLTLTRHDSKDTTPVVLEPGRVVTASKRVRVAGGRWALLV